MKTTPTRQYRAQATTLHDEADRLDRTARRLAGHAAELRRLAHREQLARMAHGTAKRVFGAKVEAMPPYQRRRQNAPPTR